MNIINAFNTSIEIGLLYSLAVIGVYISFEIIRFPDLSVDSTITLGAVTVSVFILNNMNPFFATLIAIIFGFVAGFTVGILNSKFRINKLLSSIIVLISLYSINLAIMGRSNISILNKLTIFSQFENYFNINLRIIMVCLFSVSLIIGLLIFFFKTDLGLSLRFIGENEKTLKTLGKNIGYVNSFGLGLANSMLALSGAFIAQSNGFADVNMGLGTLVICLASLIIGKSILNPSSILSVLLAMIFGSIIYQFLIALSLQIGLPVYYVKLLTGLLLVVLLSSSNISKNRVQLGIEKIKI